jgi:HTH-type transcriptional regulator, competence development regulator
MNSKSSSLGDIVRDARTARKITLRKFAAMIDKSPSYVSDIENDRRTPSEGVLREICDLLALDFDRMMALAGRFGDETERQLRKTPSLGTLLRRLAELPPEERESAIGGALQRLDRGSGTRPKR